MPKAKISSLSAPKIFGNNRHSDSPWVWLISLPCTLSVSCGSSRGSSNEIFAKQQNEITELLFSDTNTAMQAIWMKERSLMHSANFPGGPRPLTSVLNHSGKLNFHVPDGALRKQWEQLKICALCAGHIQRRALLSIEDPKAFFPHRLSEFFLHKLNFLRR